MRFVSVSEAKGRAACTVGMRGAGEFLAYSDRRPTHVVVDGTPAEYGYTAVTGALRFEVPVTESLDCQAVMLF